MEIIVTIAVALCTRALGDDGGMGLCLLRLELNQMEWYGMNFDFFLIGFRREGKEWCDY